MNFPVFTVFSIILSIFSMFLCMTSVDIPRALSILTIVKPDLDPQPCFDPEPDPI